LADPDDPYPIAAMRSSDVDRANAIPFDVIPERGQAAEYVSGSPV
jgi:hypothetical protein